MSTISGVSGSSNVWSALNTQRTQHQAKMFAKVDTDGSGGIDQAELSTLVSDVSEKTGVSLGDSKALFTQMDSNSDGSLSSDELARGMKDLLPPPTTMEFAQTRGMGGPGPGSDHLFEKVDTDGDGSISQDELQVLSDKIKADTGKDTSQDFSKLDSDGDGKLSQAEFDAGRPQPPQGQQTAQAPGGPGGPPPPGGSGGPGGAQSSSASDTTYDPLDTNQDGVVSEVERMVGELRDAVAGLSNSDSTSTVTANLKIAELAQKIYAQVSQDLSNGFTDLPAGSLSATA
jgi:Ca2+-binding EF-hand superfamily protein